MKHYIIVVSVGVRQTNIQTSLVACIFVAFYQVNSILMIKIFWQVWVKTFCRHKISRWNIVHLFCEQVTHNTIWKSWIWNDVPFLSWRFFRSYQMEDYRSLILVKKVRANWDVHFQNGLRNSISVYDFGMLRFSLWLKIQFKLFHIK